MSKTKAEVREFFHSPVDLGTSPSADYVVAHAARQRHRGRNPSVNYRDHTNPRESLAAAKADIEARNSDDGYTAAFSGRVALIRIWSERQREIAESYAKSRMENNGATGATIQNLTELGLGRDEPLPVPTPLHYRVGPGAVDAMLPL